MSKPTQATPNLFTIRKMQPHEKTDVQSVIYLDGHFFPVSLHNVTVEDYEADIYRVIAVDEKTGEPA